MATVMPEVKGKVVPSSDHVIGEMAEPKTALGRFMETKPGMVVRVIGVMTCLYFFLVGLGLMGAAFAVLAGDSAGSLFESVNNPVGGVMIGIVATVLVQSSSTSTSVVVAMVGSGILGVNQAIPIIMGANIGTSVTNTIVSMGFATEPACFQRAFAGATVHDLFNYLTVLVLLPLELITSAFNGGNGGFLEIITAAMVGTNTYAKGSKPWESPTKIITKPITSAIMSVNKDVIKDWATGKPDVLQCATKLNLCKDVDGGVNSSTTCGAYKFITKASKACTWPLNEYHEEVDPATNLTLCQDKKAYFTYCTGGNSTNATIMASAQEYYDNLNVLKGGAFYDAGLDRVTSGWICLILSLICLSISLYCIIQLLQKLVRGKAEIMLKKAFDINGYLAILVGAGITILVQSSSITTSTLTPLVAVGVISLEKMLPLTLGANIGTTCTALIAATVSGKATAVQIALCHLLFNIFGIMIWYPVPVMRNVPLNGARWLGTMAAAFNIFPLIYTIIAFLIYPIVFMGIFFLISSPDAGATAGGAVILVLILILHGAALFWWKLKGGKEMVSSIIEKRIAGSTVANAMEVA